MVVEADDDLFPSPPVEAFGVFSGEAELLIEDVTPIDVHLTQTFGGQSTLLWSSSVVLARQWWRGGGSLPEVAGRRVLELGAGLGLNAIGLAAKGALVVATEVEPALSALRRSVERNRACWAKAGGRAAVEVCELRWGETEGELFNEAFDVVVGADLLYSRALRAPLLRTLQRAVGPSTTVVLALEARGDELAFLSQAASQLAVAARCVYGLGLGLGLGLALTLILSLTLTPTLTLVARDAPDVRGRREARPVQGWGWGWG